MRQRAAIRWMVLVLALFSFGLRLHHLYVWELSFDEVASFFIAGKPVSEMLSYLRHAIREHPPLYYLTLSIWMPVAGASEFALRFPSALVGTVTVTLFYRCLRTWLGRKIALLGSLLLALSPAHIWASQTARMYAGVVLCSLLSAFFFDRLLRGPNRPSYWVGWGMATAAGLATHYYFAFLLLVENVTLVARGRRSRALYGRWIALHAAGLVLLVAWVAGTGPRETLVSIVRQGPADSLRFAGFVDLLNEVAFGPYRRLDPIAFWSVWLLAFLGLVWLVRDPIWRGLRRYGAMLAGLWLLIPAVCLLALPVMLEGRYVIGSVLPLYLLIAVAVLRLYRLWWPLGLLALLAVAVPSATALPELYHDRAGTYRARVEYLHDQARQAEPLILNGPWQHLLLRYYDPGQLRLVPIPPAAPPGVDETRDAGSLQAVFEEAKRAWVSYDSLEATDPERFVAGWLYEHTHEVFRYQGLALYYRQPSDEQAYEVTKEVNVQFGDQVQLRRARLASSTVSIGDAALVTLEFEAARDLDRELRVRIDLVGADGWIWSSYAFPPAPFDTPSLPWAAGEQRTERRGILVPPGCPPGQYTLRLTVMDTAGNPLLSPAGRSYSLFEVRAVPPDPSQQVPWVRTAQPLAVFDGRLELLRCDAWGARFSVGHPLAMTCYWRALGDLEGEYDVALRINTLGGSLLHEAITPLSRRYPPADWQPGLLIATPYGPQVPPSLKEGRYRLDVAVLHDGSERGEAESVFYFEVEWPPATYLMPLDVGRRVDAAFNEAIRLRGYDLEEVDDHLRLTLYWRALRPVDEEYVVLVHLGQPNAPPVAQADGVPVRGLRPVTTWRRFEVISDPHDIPLDGVAPGRYGLYVGLYDAVRGERLPAYDRGQPTPDRRVLLEWVEVKP